jgi:hypothetical protein
MGLLGLGAIKYIFVVIFALIGYSIATFKIPNTTAFEFTKKTGGENIDDVIRRWLKFKMTNKHKIYLYTEENIKIENNQKNGRE